MSLSHVVQEFLEYLEIERNVSKLTIRNYTHYMHRLLGFLTSQSPSPSVPSASGQAFSDRTSLTPNSITAEAVRQYRLYLSRFADEKGLTLKRVTQNYHLIALRSFLKYMIRRGIPGVLSPEMVELGKAESHSIKFLERDAVERLLGMPELSKPEGLRDKAILEVLFSTGLRVSELVSLNRDQINLERKEFGIIGKGRRTRVVFLSDTAVDWIRQYLAKRDDEHKPMFIRYSGKSFDAMDKTGESMRLTARSVQRLVEKYVRAARLPVKITPHGLRHSFATDLLTSGADLRAIQELLGHKNVSTTQIYTHITNPQLKQIHEKYHRK